MGVHSQSSQQTLVALQVGARRELRVHPHSINRLETLLLRWYTWPVGQVLFNLPTSPAKCNLIELHHK